MSPANFFTPFSVTLTSRTPLTIAGIDIRCLHCRMFYMEFDNNNHLYSCLTSSFNNNTFDALLLTGLYIYISHYYLSFYPTAFLSNGWSFYLLDNSPSFVLVLSMVPTLMILELLVRQLYHQYLQLVSSLFFFKSTTPGTQHQYTFYSLWILLIRIRQKLPSASV
jgi:hypothetical protein